MTMYLDIGAVRIQRYISRWPSLAGRRGASALLSAESLGAAVGPLISTQAETNPAAGAADGVLSLVVYDGADPRSLSKLLLEALATRCPAGEFEAVWGEGSSYVDAYEAVMKPARERGDVLSTLPSTAEFPLAIPCDLCSVDHAVSFVKTADNLKRRACADCESRVAASNVAGRDTEERLLESFPGMNPVRQFEELAGLSPGTKKNHLATVAIDGNAVGRFFTSLRERAPGASKDVISRGISDATYSALVTATRAVLVEGMTRLPVVPHVLGGDDVLVSVPARLGMEFTRIYLEAFEAATRMVVAAEAPELAALAPTASAGVVFADSSYPFAVCVEVADRLLREAKRRLHGDASGILWVDITQEGEEVPAGRRPWAPQKMSQMSAELTALKALPKSRQVSLARARRLTDRLDIPEAKPFLADGDAGVLREALSLARWWR
jgi:hypothetical protein